MRNRKRDSEHEAVDQADPNRTARGRDVTGDSSPEIAVGLGDVFQAETHGGVVLAVNASGKLRCRAGRRSRSAVGSTGALNEIPDNLT